MKSEITRSFLVHLVRPYDETCLVIVIFKMVVFSFSSARKLLIKLRKKIVVECNGQL